MGNQTKTNTTHKPVVPEQLKRLYPRFQELEDNPLFLKLTKKAYGRRSMFQISEDYAFNLRRWKREARQGRLQDIYLAMPLGDIVDAVAGFRLSVKFDMYRNHLAQTSGVIFNLIFTAILLAFALVLDDQYYRLVIGFIISILHLLVITIYFKLYETIAKAYYDINFGIQGFLKYTVFWERQPSKTLAEISQIFLLLQLIWKRRLFMIITFGCAFFILLGLVSICCAINPLSIIGSFYQLINNGPLDHLSELIFILCITSSFSLALGVHLFQEEHLPEKNLKHIDQLRELAIKAVDENIRDIINYNRPDGSW